MMLDEPQLVISEQRGPNERILWTGKPKSGVRLRSSDVFLIPFSLLWGGFALFWETMVLVSHIWFFALFGIPFVLIGLYFIFGRFIVDAVQRSKTYYGVTNERIIIVSGLMSRGIKSINLRTLGEMTLDEKGDKSGTITFGPATPMTAMYGGMSWPGMGRYVSPSFDMIPDAKKVYDLIRTAQSEG